MTLATARVEEHAGEPGRLRGTNVGTWDRAVSGLAGAGLAAFGLSRRGKGGLAMAAAGAWFVYRSVRGQDPAYRLLGINTASAGAGSNAVIAHQDGIRVEQAVTINRPRAELYRYWRNVENLPRFMGHLESVTALDRTHSRWTAQAPAGRSISWDAEIFNEREDELIAWKTVGGHAEIENAGSVHFTDAPGGRGTEVRVELMYDPPAGPAGAAVARLFRQEPGLQVREDLRRFKEIMEAGEIARNQTQPATGESPASDVLATANR